MISISEGQPPQNKAFSIQNEVYLGSRYILVMILSCVTQQEMLTLDSPLPTEHPGVGNLGFSEGCSGLGALCVI